MSAAIKLMRIGKRGYAAYRIVVMDKRKKRNSSYIDKIGFYDPHTNPSTIEVDENKLRDWLLKGAIVSEGVNKLLSKRIKKL